MNASTAADSVTIDPAEAARFGKMATDWWNPNGSSAMLHKLNPPRLAYLRERIDAHWGSDPKERRPLIGRRVLDAGCGAGLLSEPLARMGGAVTGIDAAPENIAVAWLHAERQGLSIDYRHGEVAQLVAEGLTFDLVTSMEVIEHVTDPAAFVAALASLLAPGGMLVISTPNRTVRSRLMMITLGEGVGGIPKGTHDWDKFLTPDELTAELDTAGLKVVDRRGLGFSPSRGFHLTDDLSLDYFLTAVAG